MEIDWSNLQVSELVYVALNPRGNGIYGYSSTVNSGKKTKFSPLTHTRLSDLEEG